MTGARDVARRTPRRSGGRRGLMIAPAAALVIAGIFVTLVGASLEGSADRSDGHMLAHLFHQPGATFSQSRLSRSSIAWNGGPTIASTGETVNVFVSASLPLEHGTPQTWADFIAGLLHGPELSSLTARIATFAEMQEICGRDALGCYGANEMISMGETMFGITAAEVVRHEYGHHIALHRINSPWLAIDWGPKNWASASNVCRREDDGGVYPGDEGVNYSLNPGEAWAETYRLLDEQKAGVSGTSWGIVDTSFYPNEVALEAAERDVLRPWTAATTSVSGNRFRRQGKRVWTLPLATPLDGSVDITVKLPKGGLHDVVLLRRDRRTVVARGLWASTTTKRITSTVCGDRALVLRITQKGAFGQVRVSSRLP